MFRLDRGRVDCFPAFSVLSWIVLLHWLRVHEITLNNTKRIYVSTELSENLCYRAARCKRLFMREIDFKV